MGTQLPAQHRVEPRVQVAEAGEIVDLRVVVRAGEAEGGDELGGHGGVEAGFPGGVVREEGDDGGLRPGYEGVGAGRLRVRGDVADGAVGGRGNGEGGGGGEGREDEGGEGGEGEGGEAEEGWGGLVGWYVEWGGGEGGGLPEVRRILNGSERFGCGETGWIGGDDREGEGGEGSRGECSRGEKNRMQNGVSRVSRFFFICGTRNRGCQTAQGMRESAKGGIIMGSARLLTD